MAMDKDTKQRLEKEARAAREAARQARRDAAARASNGNDAHPTTSIGDVRSAVKDYRDKRGTSSAHIFHTAVQAGIATYDALQRAPYNLPRPAIDLLKVYAAANKEARKEISLELDRSTRQTAISAIATHVGLSYGQN